MAQERNGLKKLVALAKIMCATLAIFGPTLRKKFADNESLMTALDLAEAACTALAVAGTQAIVVGD